MNTKKGQQITNSTFFSDGPKGRIQKAVFYKYVGKADGFHYFNVGFGDYDQITKTVNDLTVSDNKDREKVLATVAATALEFTRRIKKSRLAVTGSTPARTRLYQMKIAEYYDDISQMFDIQGKIQNRLEKFKKNTNYSGFQFQKNS